MDDQITKATPLEFLEAVYCNNELPLHTRMRAAEAALPYVHPKLAVTAIIEGKDIAARLEQAIKRANKARQEPKVINQPVDDIDAVLGDRPEPRPIKSILPVGAMDRRYRR